MPDRPSKLARIDFPFFLRSIRRAQIGLGFSAATRPYAAAKGVGDDEPERFLPGPPAGTRWRVATGTAMSRKVVWIEEERFRGFGCSECGWRFRPSGAPTGASFDEMMRNFELQRDKEFTSHVCAPHSERVR